MTPSLSGGRKRKKKRRDWDKRGSILGSHDVHEPTLQGSCSQREAAQESGTRLSFFLI
jgi:hypothetical protein